MEYKLGHLFELTPAWVSSLLLLALLMLAEEAGYRLARKRRAGCFMVPVKGVVWKSPVRVHPENAP